MKTACMIVKPKVNNIETQIISEMFWDLSIEAEFFIIWLIRAAHGNGSDLTRDSGGRDSGSER